MSGQQRQREGWRRGGEGTEEHEFNAATRLARERQKKKRGGRKAKEVCDAVQTDWPLRNSRGRQKASRSRAAQCGVQSGPESYIIEWSHAVTKISGEINHSARVTGGQSREHIKQLLYP